MKELLSHFGCFILGALTMLFVMALCKSSKSNDEQ